MRRIGPGLVALLVLLAGVAALCARLGFWQLSRWEEKRAQNARGASALAGPPVKLDAASALPESLLGRRVEIHGRYDENRHILLRGRPHQGEPGVHVVTPLVTDGRGVLVLRGWLPAADGASASPERYPEPGQRTVHGVALPLPRGVAGPPWLTLRADTLTLWSARTLGFDSVSLRLPYPVAPWLVQELPAAGVPTEPARVGPEPLDEGMHLGYAIQWFVMAAFSIAGALFLLLRRGTGGRTADSNP